MQVLKLLFDKMKKQLVFWNVEDQNFFTDNLKFESKTFVHKISSHLYDK